MSDTPVPEPQVDFHSFVEIVRRLRKECPWDRDQTHDSMRTPFIEEVYEAVDAIGSRDWPALAEELGDVLLNVVFQAVLAEEAGRFTIADVLARETGKLVFRHPHVFGDVTADDVDQVLRNWEQLKKAESDRESVLDGVPRALPALLFAERVQSKAARVGFDFPTREGAWEKVTEEVKELRAVDPADRERWSEELGDLLFAVVNLGRLNGVSPEMELRAANDKFTQRFRHIEGRLREQGRGPDDASLEEMDQYWEEAKKC
ncbi:MAG TPA: nucleoside triphosphate pyrophosphohydrolase [Rhodothermales bacterium]|nr:nucleoside triphosphate pyrophosphohydrolase [Rhodothermales bacterium]